MKAKGPRYERETIINFSEESDTASIWTASEQVYRRLLKAGWKPSQDSDRHAVFSVPKRTVKLPRQPKKVSQAQKEALSRARAVATGPKQVNQPISE